MNSYYKPSFATKHVRPHPPRPTHFTIPYTHPPLTFENSVDIVVKHRPKTLLTFPHTNSTPSHNPKLAAAIPQKCSVVAYHNNSSLERLQRAAQCAQSAHVAVICGFIQQKYARPSPRDTRQAHPHPLPAAQTSEWLRSDLPRESEFPQHAPNLQLAGSEFSA